MYMTYFGCFVIVMSNGYISTKQYFLKQTGRAL